MASEPDTLPQGGTDNAFSETDNPNDWDYFDRDEDHDTEEAEASGTDDEPDEGKDAQEAEEAADDEGDGDEEPEPELVMLEGGAQVTMDDLKRGYLRQADYTRKAQALSNDRKRLAADVQRLEGITTAFVDHIAKLLPPEPTVDLAERNPSEYLKQKARYDAAVSQVQALMDLGAKPKELAQSVSQEDRSRLLAEENQKLVAMFPKTATQKGREKFFSDVQSVANDLGYTTRELQGVTDHRIFALAHWARIGMEAEKNRAKAAAKVADAPPATPRKPGQQAATARNGEAMRKFLRKPTIANAAAAWGGD